MICIYCADGSEHERKDCPSLHRSAAMTLRLATEARKRVEQPAQEQGTDCGCIGHPSYVEEGTCPFRNSTNSPHPTGSLGTSGSRSTPK